MSRLVILGGGESGWGTAVLGKQKGWEVFLSDGGAINDNYRECLKICDVEFEEGGHTERIFPADLVVKSPGIPDTAPVVTRFREAGVEVVSEIEFAGRYLDGAKTICITGSNGKTTTTTLIYNMLHNAGFKVALGGNIGRSFAYNVALGGVDWHVLEISSFQLDGMFSFRADIAVLCNITPDHLDRYDHKMENYAASKFRITQNQRPDDTFIYCADDPETLRGVEARKLAGALPMQLLPYSSRQLPPALGAGVQDGTAVCHAGDTSAEFETSKLRISGAHNIQNAEGAALAALSAGVPAETILSTLYNFGGIEHRCEFAGKYDNVLWINDSKATNVEAVWYALDGVTRPVVWIAGGTDKGNDYASLMELARQKVHTLICMGVDNQKLLKAFEGVIPAIADTHSLDEAMNAAKKAARKGDVVLLSPACASFDLFKNYEDRGRQFKEKVKQLYGNQNR